MPSSQTKNLKTDSEFAAIDTLFEEAGLVRSLRGKAGAISLRARKPLEQDELDELPQPSVPRTAPNGVQLLTVPAWQISGNGRPGNRIGDWLWHGFSTRRGGLSRAYCAEDAPGELNLGFTAADTLGNAREAADWARAMHYRRLILVTADYHMPRAMIELRAALPEAAVQPYPVATPVLDARHWSSTSLGARRMVVEYSKYLPILAREATLGLGPSMKGAP